MKIKYVLLSIVLGATLGLLLGPLLWVLAIDFYIDIMKQTTNALMQIAKHIEWKT